MKEATLRRLAAIQPIRQLRYLISQIVEALAQETGVPTNDAIYTALTSIIQKHSDLASVDWRSLFLSLVAKATSDANTTGIALDYARLLLDRAEVQADLYLDAKHFFTLTLTTNHRYRLPQAIPREKLPDVEDFNYSMLMADTFLDKGQATLKRFEQLLQQYAPFPQMRVMLDQAHEYYVAYQRSHKYGDRIYEELCTDLASTREHMKALAA